MKEKRGLLKQPGIITTNRFSVLAKQATAASAKGRDRLLSLKRQGLVGDEEEEEEVEEGREVNDGSEVFVTLEKTEVEIKEAKGLLDEIEKEMEKVSEDGPIKTILGKMAQWMKRTTTIQENTASVILDEVAKGRSKTGGGGVSKQVRGNGGGGAPQEGNRKGRDEEGEADTRKKKFIQAVKEAEKSTLVFNLDMGNVPVMNTATMSRYFSLALKAKAAEVDGGVNGEPKGETVTQLDDTLSMVRSMDYFGKTTKKAKDKEYFTIPVKLAFKDKDTKIAAEQNLRKLCKVSCTTPYHATLRDFIRTVVDECKGKYRDTFIQAKVDAENMRLRISYLEKGEWHNDVELVDLPDSVYDTANKVSRFTAKAGRGERMETGSGEPARG